MENLGPKPWHRLVALTRTQTVDIEPYGVVITGPGYRVALTLPEVKRILDEAHVLAQERAEWEEAYGNS